MAKTDPSLNIPTARSSDAEWINWHQNLKKMFGKKDANAIWVFAWSKRGGVDNPANTTGLSNYMEKQGVDIERSTLDEIGEGLYDFTSGALTVGKWIILIPLGIGGIILILILIKLFRSPNANIGNALKMMPQGKAMKGLKK